MGPCPECLQVPWDDLRYIFGEIMYGGHIVEDWDRRLAAAYLLKYFNENLIEGMEMFPGFMAPGNSLNHKHVRASAVLLFRDLCCTNSHGICDQEGLVDGRAAVMCSGSCQLM